MLVDGRPVRGAAPRELADLVGFVGQDPVAGFVTEVVEDELAYGMEQLGVAPGTMRRRVEETLDLLGIAELRAAPLRTLSGGQQQRVAIGAVLTMHPRALVLDEPTSALDPTAAEEVLGTLARLVDDLGLTVVLAEHRMERVVPFADRLCVVDGGRVRAGDPAEMLQTSAGRPAGGPARPAGRLAPLPLSVREARRRALARWRRRPGDPPRSGRPAPGRGRAAAARRRGALRPHGRAARGRPSTSHAGRVTALMGRNGSGKSSLLWALQGTGAPARRTVSVDGRRPGRLGEGPARLVGLVPADRRRPALPGDRRRGVRGGGPPGRRAAGTCRALLDGCSPASPATGTRATSPRASGWRWSWRSCSSRGPPVVALDEPTRGLDYDAKAHLAAIVRRLAGAGPRGPGRHPRRRVRRAGRRPGRRPRRRRGRLHRADAAVLAESPAFAPQTTKILGEGWLTVEQVRAAIA